MKRVFLLPLLTLAFFICLPFAVQGYWLRVLTSVFMYGVMAQSVNIISGFGGYPALGNSVFFGVGAYATALGLSYFHGPFPFVLITSGFFCFCYALVVGIPVLRLRGRYFLMATIGLLELSKEIVINLDFLGGSRGITLSAVSSNPTFLSCFFYYVMLAILTSCTIVVAVISKIRFGFALRAIKFDEDAAGVMGISPVPYKVIAWSLSAFFTGLAGGTFAYWMSYIEPPVVFDIATTVKMYLMFIFGGPGTVLGPVIGAFFIELISELVWGKFFELHYLILGSVIIVVVVFLPNGLIGFLRSTRLRRLF
jgi:branched-chain amino acid transport system permease protein